MIVDTMTFEEICQEFDKILGKYKPRLNTKTTLSKNKKIVMRHKHEGDKFFLPISCKVDDNTQIHSILTPNSYQNEKKTGGIEAPTFVTFRNKHGLNVVMQMGKYDDYYGIITSHFFNRYNERFLKNLYNSKYDIIFYYIHSVKNYLFRQFPMGDNQNHFIGLNNNVIFFAERIKYNIFLMKTCISVDMINRSQTNVSAILNDDFIEFSKIKDGFNIANDDYIKSHKNINYFTDNINNIKQLIKDAYNA